MAKLIGLFILMFWLTACGVAGQYETQASGLRGQEALPEEKPEYVSYSSLPWEAQKPNSRLWSNYLYWVIDQEAPDLLIGSDDLSQFCPKYLKLPRAEKIQFWGHLFSQISRYESEFNPVLRSIEKGKTDAITGRQLYSEGLLQMSYQDLQMMPKCDFDWSIDQGMSSNNPAKSVLSPFKNLRCGVLILNQQVHRAGKIVLGNGAYWAVIKSNADSQKIREIWNYTRSLKFCASE